MKTYILKLLQWVEKRWLGLTLVILAVVTVLSLWPLNEPPPVPGTDKTHHLIAYTALMLPTAIKRPKRWFWIGLLIISYSGMIELLQPFVNRHAEWLDLAANTGGVLCALLLGWLLLVLFPDKN